LYTVSKVKIFIRQGVQLVKVFLAGFFFIGKIEEAKGHLEDKGSAQLKALLKFS